MGNEAGVGIEPELQTKLCDDTENVPGVLCAGVPGAGGEDAIFAIILDIQVRDNVENLWSTWGEAQSRSVCPLLLHAETKEKSGISLELGF